MWIARDKDGSLYIYRHKPKKMEEEFISDKEDNYYQWDEEVYPLPFELTFEKSPVEIEIKRKE